jgi:hypothetical protein
MSDQEYNDSLSEVPAENAGGGDDDLVNALGGSETTFVTGETSKKPINRTLLAIVGVLAVGGGALYFTHFREGPAAANAAPTMSTTDANKRISQLLGGGTADLKNTEKFVQQFMNYPSLIKQVPLGDLKTNPFRYSTTADPKSAAPDPDVKKKMEAQRQAALKSVQDLQLQSVMKGEQRSTCMINNTLYREGQTVNDFFIEKINPNSVVVRTGDYRFELRMQK